MTRIILEYAVDCYEKEPMNLLRIPHRLSAKADPISTLLRRKHWLIPIFTLRSQERYFCQKILQKHKNWWIYRCNQKRSMGDFILVDMSSPHHKMRKVWVVELKYGQPFQHKKGFQLRHGDLAIEDLQSRNIISSECRVTYIQLETGCYPFYGSLIFISNNKGLQGRVV